LKLVVSIEEFFNLLFIFISLRIVDSYYFYERIRRINSRLEFES
jgi:hypothetical protein